MKRHTVFHLGLALALLAFFVGCYSPPLAPPPPEIVRTDKNPEFDSVREDLVDIVVLSARPPEGNPQKDGPHLRRFRRLVYEGLIRKGYSPFKFSFTDQITAGAPSEERFDPAHNINRYDEDAVMVLSLNEWDVKYRKKGAILVSATLSLIRSKTNTKLWMHEIRHRLYKIPLTADDVSLTINEVVMDLVVKDLLEKLPSRA